MSAEIRVEDLDEPLREPARRLGIDELRTRVHRPGFLEAEHGSHDGTCPECSAYITETPTYGEVGHRPRCPNRESEYTGQAGRKEEPTGAALGGEPDK